MTTVAMAGAAVLLYYTGWGSAVSLWNKEIRVGMADKEVADADKSRDLSRRRVVIHRPSRPPSTWYEALSTLSETLRFTYSETLGKWPIGDLAFGINFLLRRQGHFHVAGVFAGEDSTQLRGAAVIAELKELLRLLLVCMHFSKKPFGLFLEATGYTKDNVLFQEGKAGILKPAFTILVDDTADCILLVIRGTHSVKDTLTAVTGAIVPFHHAVLDQGGVKNLVLGYAHCGMVAAARWIAQLAIPYLLQALIDHPTYKLKIVGHSLGGGTAALLTYILRERGEFQSATCVSFAPAACMTWELAESGNSFVTSVVNGSDLVPTFSVGSADDLRAEVTASAWINDFREQIERTRVLRMVVRSASALGSRLSSIASLSRNPSATVARAAQSGVASAGAIWRPVSTGTQVVFKQAQNVAQAVVRTRSSLGLASWSCIGARKVVSASPADTSIPDSSFIQEMVAPTEIGITREDITTNILDVEHMPSSSHMEDLEEEEQHLQEAESRVQESVKQMEVSTYPLQSGNSSIFKLEEFGEHVEIEEDDGELPHPVEGDDVGEEEIWRQLEEEISRQREDSSLLREEEEAAAREITQEEETLISTVTESCQDIVGDSEGGGDLRNRFFPPGRIMHIVCPLHEDDGSRSDDENQKIRVGMFLTNRKLYGKVRLSHTMVHDHYMPTYRRMMEALILELENEISDHGVELGRTTEDLDTPCTMDKL